MYTGEWSISNVPLGSDESWGDAGRVGFQDLEDSPMLANYLRPSGMFYVSISWWTLPCAIARLRSMLVSKIHVYGKCTPQ